MKQTPNYKLTQWAKDDRIQMEPFNEDNAKIDSALKTQADAIAARATTSALKAETTARTKALATLSAAVEKLGNCQLYSTSYVGQGKGTTDEPKTVTFPHKPIVVFVCGSGIRKFWAIYGMKHFSGYAAGEQHNFIWGERSISYYINGQSSYGMDVQGDTFYLAALLDTTQ